MADGSIDRLSISIGASSSKAVSQINNLATALQKLRVAVSTIDSGSASKIQGLATALQGLKGIGTIKLSVKLPAQLKSIADTANSVSDDAIS